MMSLSLQAVMTCTMLNFPVSCWLEMASKLFSDVGSFTPIMRIQTFIMFLDGNAWFHGILFSDWDMYEMLWCSKYCVVVPMGVPLCGKLILTSNISSRIKGWSERSIFNFGRVEIFVPIISSEPGDQPLPKLLLCSSVFRWTVFESLCVWVPPFHCGSAVCVTHEWSLFFYVI